MTIIYISGNKIQGLSTDTKPTNPQDNSTFYETDTNTISDYIGGAWVDRPPAPMTGHVIPSANDTYDIGSAEFKVRDAYISDNSLWVGDDHKVEISGGKMKFKKRKNNRVPTVITSAGGSEAAAKSNRSRSNLTDMTLNDWVKYARSLGGSLANAKPNDIFKSDDSDDWETDDATISATGTAGKILGYNASTGELEEQDAPVGGAPAGGLVLPYDSTIGNFTTPTTLVASSDGQEDDATSQQWGSFNSQGYSDANPVMCSGVLKQTATPAGAPVDLEIDWTFQFSHGYGWGSGGISVVHSGGESCLATSSASSYSTSGTSYFTGVTAVRSWGRNYTGSAGGSKYNRVIATFTSDLHTQLPISQAKDDNTSTRWMSETEDNPNVTMDMGSSTRMDHVAINYDSGDGSTETQFLVQTSDDNSTWTTQRTINFTQLSNGWNYIRFTPVTVRYVRLYGTGTSKRISLRELKVKNSISDTTLYETHGHKTISTSDTSISLNGD